MTVILLKPRMFITTRAFRSLRIVRQITNTGYPLNIVWVVNSIRP